MQYGKSIVALAYSLHKYDRKLTVTGLGMYVIVGARVAGDSFKRRSLVGRLVDKCATKNNQVTWISPGEFFYCSWHPAGSEISSRDKWRTLYIWVLWLNVPEQERPVPGANTTSLA